MERKREREKKKGMKQTFKIVINEADKVFVRELRELLESYLNTYKNGFSKLEVEKKED
jgi:hypothetical protein